MCGIPQRPSPVRLRPPESTPLRQPDGNRSARPRRYQRGPHIISRNGYLWAYIPGRLPFSLRTRDASEAERRFAGIVGGTISACDPMADPKECSIAAIVSKFIADDHGYTLRTRRSAAHRATAFLEWCTANGVTVPSAVTEARVDQWLADRLRTVTRRTATRDLRVLRVMFRWACRKALCGAVPIVNHEDMLDDDNGVREPLVYFVRARDGLVKVGFTTNLPQRLVALRTHCGSEIDVIAVGRGSREDERAIHRRLETHRRRGEWFEPHALVLAAAEEHRQRGAEAHANPQNSERRVERGRT